METLYRNTHLPLSASLLTWRIGHCLHFQEDIEGPHVPPHPHWAPHEEEVYTEVHEEAVLPRPFLCLGITTGLPHFRHQTKRQRKGPISSH